MKMCIKSVERFRSLELQDLSVTCFNIQLRQINDNSHCATNLTNFSINKLINTRITQLVQCLCLVVQSWRFKFIEAMTIKKNTDNKIL